MKRIRTTLGEIVESIRSIFASKSFVVVSNEKDLEERLKEVDSHVVLPKGKYVIDFDITVAETGTLEIEPGTEIHFGPNGGIQSYGTLRAVGTEEENIVFTAAGEERWKNILITSPRDMSSYGRIEKLECDSILEYCRISRGGGREQSFTIDGDKGLFGGGVSVWYTHPTIRNCVIEDNYAEAGGGICVDEGVIIEVFGNQGISRAVIESNTVRNNQAEYGGGIASNSHSTLTKNTITGNTARIGGGAYVMNSDFRDNRVVDNKAEQLGGGLFLASTPRDSTVENNTIEGNEAKEGGGIYAGEDYLARPSSPSRGPIHNPKIKGNVIQKNKAEENGGGVVINADIYFEGNKILDNSSANGAGIYVRELSPFLRGNRVEGNEAKNCGGGIYLDGSAPTIAGKPLYNSCPTLEENTIVNNQADSGAGLYVLEKSPHLKGNKVESNEAKGCGGGIYFKGPPPFLWHLDESKPELSGNTVSHNQADFGAGLYFDMSRAILWEDNTITDNRAKTFGGGVYFHRSNPFLKETTLTHNQAHSGGGMYIDSDSEPTLEGNTVTQNQASSCGGGVYLPKARKKILKGNRVKKNQPDNVFKE